jgi:adenosylhomocysteine nucleosidase
MKILTVVPTRIELNAFLKACQAQGYHSELVVTGRFPVVYFPGLDMTVAQGGLGKTQFALQTQHLIDAGHWDLVICAGAAGALQTGLAKGDVVISTETVEYGTPNKSDPLLLRRFSSAKGILRQCHQVIQTEPVFNLLTGPIASVDKFVLQREYRSTLFKVTNALVVAMEGAGGAHASQISGVPFVEIRTVTDNANVMAVFDFILNLNKAMKNLAQVVISLACAGLEDSCLL